MKWLALLSLIAVNLVQEPAPVVWTGNGRVRGRVSGNGKYYQYFGIPYGTVDETNRFQAPLPPPKWQGIFEAVNENTRCPQKMIGSVVVGDPDCLKLNIYTPVNRRHDKLLPVMVYIHGGCFLEGTGSSFLYGGDYFVEHGVVFVGINYRLNVEGFLCLGIKEAPGNAGLKDQIAALKWIKENIRAFGGNPDKVTLFGESAGSVSTSFMILSPAAKGLFHRAILQSGSSLAPWALQHNPIEMARSLVKEFGHDTKDPYKIYDILSKKSVAQLINAIKNSKHKGLITSDMLFAPCVENKIPGVEPVITEYPAEVIKSGNYSKVPMIVGFNDNEGIYFVAKDYGTSAKQVDPNEMFNKDLVFKNEIERNQTVQVVKEHYFSMEKDDLIMRLVDLYSDLHFKFPIMIESQLYAQTTDQPIYYYLFKYSGYMNIPKMVSFFGYSRGASHADELFYMFKPHSFPTPHRYLENQMIERMLTLWTNFAKYGDPTPKSSQEFPVRWRPGRPWDPTALVIDRHMTTGPLWDHTSLALWNDTYAKHRRKYYGFQYLSPK